MTDYRTLLGLEWLHEKGHGGSGVKIAVLDTGIPDHVCKPAGSKNFTSDAYNTDHASVIASILFGRDDVKGICPEASAYFAKVFSYGLSRPETVAKAIDYATDVWNVDIINLSLGFAGNFQCPECVRESCEKASKKGVLLIAATGESKEHMMWPAALSNVVSVGSVDTWGDRKYDSDVLVPGTDLEGQRCNGSLCTMSGTSFAAAVATGVAALDLARRRASGLERTPEMLTSYLESSKIRKRSSYGLMINRICGRITSFAQRLSKIIKKRGTA